MNATSAVGVPGTAWLACYTGCNEAHGLWRLEIPFSHADLLLLAGSPPTVPQAYPPIARRGSGGRDQPVEWV